jgi:hypothetical protein
MHGVADVPPHHLNEQGIALGRPDRRHVADRPQHETGNPQAKPETDRRRQGAVEDGDGTRRAGEQDRLGERAMDGGFVAGDRRKNDDAAKAIDRPNTIWIRRRNPPAVSPKASVKPVTMMMITATILETGPSIDCRIC